MYKRAGKFLQCLHRKRNKPSTQLVLSPTLNYPRFRLKLAKHRKRRTSSSTGSRVYLVEFTARVNPDIKFLKIGISSLDLEARFQLDLDTYAIKVLASSPRMPTPQAFDLEQAMHKAFRGCHQYPEIPLSSGNTECYRHTEHNVKRFVNLINQL